MAHFAQLDDNNNVTNVIVISNDDITDNTTGLEEESFGVAACQKLMGASTKWKKTSYSADGHGYRGTYAGIGMTYAENVATLGVASTDIFIGAKPFPSWRVGINTAHWYAPIDGPPALTNTEIATGKMYIWDEDAYQADTNDPKTVGWALTAAL
tara:strand:- start:53 stop:514 length:462 start_codon:yes stop_codon:yes gene_type:complete